jgi:hypothetical protein
MATLTLCKGIVSRDWDYLLMVSVDSHIVLDVPETYLNSILWSSSYVKFKILYVCIRGSRFLDFF